MAKSSEKLDCDSSACRMLLAAAVRGCSLRQILTPVRFENLCCIELVFVIPEVAVASPWTSKSRYSNVYTTGRLFVLGEVGLCIRHPIKPPLLILAVSWFEGAVLKRSCPYTLSLHQNVPEALEGLPDLRPIRATKLLSALETLQSCRVAPDNASGKVSEAHKKVAHELVSCSFSISRPLF